MRRGGRQEFTRAEALLAGKRIVAKGKQEQEGIGKSKPTIRASSSSTRCLSVIPTDSDLSNLSSSKSPCVGREEPEDVGPADTTRLAQPGSRFLKQKPQNVEVDIQQAGLCPVTRVGIGVDSKGRSNAILRKLAQIESKIQSRKTKQSIERIPVVDVELSLSESSKDFELRTGSLKFLKKPVRLKESVKTQTKNVTLADKTGDSEEDADRCKQEVPQKPKGQEDKFKFQSNGKLLPETSSNLRSLPEESQVNRPLYFSPYSPNRDTRASHVASCSSSPSMKDSPADTISHNRSSNCQRKSLSERSIIRSLDELFSEVTDTHNDISSNSDDVPAVVGHAIQQSAAEAPCISGHKLNMEVIEALSMYNPSIAALNNMLKQNLLLIQQSIEINRHLHASFVASLEEEEYRYHTLEEAKMYIQKHKPLPLTMEQALQELKEYEQMAS
ncbi:uncharacterized protein C19orf44 homolog isoform X2 [Ahaetulla prasina]|uniref:uncharacterized protein C19orf44 homolog isoform X2 n=1 Tax=Ahaetulla prasina TaxID=499056 RepID=UPI0026479BEB|nr:uncharacterized protein C19orf44 homolog isoform X2 [Ahaetulla prasina]